MTVQSESRCMCVHEPRLRLFLGILLAQTRAVMLDLSDEKLWLHLEVAHASARETGFRNVAESLLRKSQRHFI